MFLSAAAHRGGRDKAEAEHITLQFIGPTQGQAAGQAVAVTIGGKTLRTVHCYTGR